MYPNDPGHERCPVEASYSLHHGKVTVVTGPHGRLHQRWRRPARTGEVRILKPPLQIVLPRNEQQDEDDADDEERNDTCI